MTAFPPSHSRKRVKRFLLPQMVGACTAVLLLPGMPRLEAQALPSNDAPPVVKENASAIPSALDNMIPIGETYLGVKVPSYQGDRKSSVMEARSMRRVDTEHLDIAGLVVRVYDLETGEMTTIVVEKAIYDIPSKKLITRTRTRIEKSGQFQMEGDRLEFDTKARVGRMEGNVVTNLENANGAPGKTTPVETFSLPETSPSVPATNP